jgi:mediator of RNA polymerase II transcription subunit 12, fungi type
VYFPSGSDVSTAFKEKLKLLLDWSVTPLQYGDHRIYVAVTILRLWRDRARFRAYRKECLQPDDAIQDTLFDWLNDSTIAHEPGNLEVVACLFGHMVSYELFSYSRYIQRLIARGERGLELDQVYTQRQKTTHQLMPAQEPESKHRKFVQSIPFPEGEADSATQRRILLYGLKSHRTVEEASDTELKTTILTALPAIFLGTTPSIMLDNNI